MHTHDPARALVSRRAAFLGVLLLSLVAHTGCQSGPFSGSSGSADELASRFVNPPDSARPWVYWFWLNGNITREGITADLEAMKRVGIGGVLIMEVDQGAPVGPIDFVGPQWRELFQHVVVEAERLGLEVNMNNDAGWNGSGGPWIEPELSMQKVVWSEVEVGPGGSRFEADLPQPETVAGFYRDIAVLAFPTPGAYRIEGFAAKAGFRIGWPGEASTAPLAPEMTIERGEITDLTPLLDSAGRLVWDVPAGEWTIQRFGHTSTGVVNQPAPASGRGLECDKLAKEGIEANFAGLMAKLIEDVGPGAGTTLVTTHIDSWENGAQNWTARMRDEFYSRRGYDLQGFLPVMTGRVVDSLEVSERFLWDLRRTISDLILDHYAGHFATLAHQHGLKFSLEAYVAPCDELAFAGRADEPMAEFWTHLGMMDTLKEMSSGAHIYGRPIVGAEAFTAGSAERWLWHPADLKALGDRAFCDGINRFVFHRYAMQPWLDREPGMTMGPWGQHYERTQTWWEWTPEWHRYLSRCQSMLREGLFVADLCYLQPEAAPQRLVGHPAQPYDWDSCNAEVVLTRMTVKDGCLVLPDGMSYRLLVLPESRSMTPKLLGRIEELVAAGATVVGPKPLRSPSLRGYPECDEEVARLAGELYGDCDGASVTESRHGKGRVVWGVAPEEVLEASGVPPDFRGPPTWRAIHRATEEADLYFVSNQQPTPLRSSCTFRVSGKRPELWWPESGRMEPAPVAVAGDGVTRVLLTLGPSESVFVVFREEGAPAKGAVTSVARDGERLWAIDEQPQRPVVVSARYGVLDDPARTRDVRAKAQAVIDGGEYSFRVARMAAGDDPAYGIVKTLVLECEHDGHRYTVTGTDPETITVASAPVASEIFTLRRGTDDRLLLETSEPGRYALGLASGGERVVTVPELPEPYEVRGPWSVEFPAGAGAPERIVLEELVSLSESSDPRVKHFSGTATWSATLDVPKGLLAEGRRLYLDLGKVEVMAEPALNGTPLGTLWRPPFRVDVTDLVRPGPNTLEVKVVNLWPNRMIGDEELPEDSERNDNGTLKAWPEWLEEGQPSPTGRLTFSSWRLWKKGSELLPSGLLGPVRLECAAVVPIGR